MSSSRLFHKEDVTGKTVIDSTGQVTGKVKDVMFALDGTVILLVEKKDGTEIQLPLSKVTGVSEFVVTRSESLPQSRSLSPGSSTGAGAQLCKFCGHEISSASVYCPSCGKSQS
jgi:sporulation protein YlmC with PRC-barrel domain